MKKLLEKIKKHSSKIKIATGAMAVGLAVPRFAHASTDPGLSINFDVSKMFEWAQVILDALTPILYVTLGISLGFLIIRSLRSAF